MPGAALHKLASPNTFSTLSARLTPWIAAAAVALLAYGLWYALIEAPADYQQGEAVRIMYVHVPAAWLAIGVYMFIGGASASYLIWKHPLADVLAREAAPLGAVFTALCMFTGALWGKPMWGAWWVWDARLTSVLVLFFLYVGYMALAAGAEASERSKRACAILALIGLANIPVIRFSVEWWNTLHQPASVLRAGGSAIHDPGMRAALYSMALAYLAVFALCLLWRTRRALLARKLARMAVGS